jgi:hypothetical protein
MEGIMTEEAKNERERKPEDDLEIHEGEGIKAGVVLNIRGNPTTSEFKFTFVTSQPQRMWPTQDMRNGRVRVNNPRMKILENFKPACISTDVSFAWSEQFMYLPVLDRSGWIRASHCSLRVLSFHGSPSGYGLRVMEST